MKAFRAKQIKTLVATDVAARGIDVDNITHVIHYQLPDEIETYTHRSGRTGRASSLGTSMIILTKGELGKSWKQSKLPAADPAGAGSRGVGSRVGTNYILNTAVQSYEYSTVFTILYVQYAAVL